MKPKRRKPVPDPSAAFGEVTAVPAEGARVGLVTCLICFATLTLHPGEKFNVLESHAAWHRRSR